MALRRGAALASLALGCMVVACSGSPGTPIGEDDAATGDDDRSALPEPPDAPAPDATLDDSSRADARDASGAADASGDAPRDAGGGVDAATDGDAGAAVLWHEDFPDGGPPPRDLPTMVFDSKRSKCVLFGGYYASANLNDTWEWDGITWTQAHPATNPPTRSSHAMAYDSVRGETVLFGGYPQAPLNDTWVWDGTDWTQRFPTTSPEPRDGHGMAFDSARGKTVLFGGAESGGTTTYFVDTWEWDGSNWTEYSPTNSPPPRRYPAMAFDSKRGRVVLFGGYDPNQVDRGDTWEWDGSTWTNFPVAGPSNRYGAGMVYDPVRERTLLFGGSTGGTETWAWDGASWALLSSSGPSNRMVFGMTYDSSRKKTFLFGGYELPASPTSFVADTWELR